MSKKAKSSNFQSLKTLPIWTWLFPVLAAIGVFLGLLLVIIPSIQGLAADRQSVGQLKSRLDQLEAKRVFLESLSLTQLQADLELSEAVLPEEKPVYPYMQAIQNLIERHEDLAMTGYKLSPGEVSTASAQPEMSEAVQTMPTELGLQGPITSLMAFFTDFERFAPMVSISLANLSGQITQDIESDELAITQIKVGVHNSPRPESISAIDAPIHAYEGDFDRTRALLQAHTSFDDGEMTLPVQQYGRDNPFTY